MESFHVKIYPRAGSRRWKATLEIPRISEKADAPRFHIRRLSVRNIISKIRTEKRETKLTVSAQQFDSQSTNVAAGQMRNALNALSDTVKDPQLKKVRHIPGEAERRASAVWRTGADDDDRSLRLKWTTFLPSSGAT